MKKLFVLFSAVILCSAGFGAQNISAQKKPIKKTSVPTVNDWVGVWIVPSRFTGSTLTVKKASAGKFQFDIEASNGANTGAISGFAVIKSAKAYFDDREQTGEATDKQGCRLIFTHKGAFIDVEQTNECQHYAGNAVYFSGEYYKDSRKIEKDNLVTLEVFPDAALDGKFKSLVGKDYEKFLESFHIISEETDLDAFGAKVFAACVRGICPFNAGIIMYDKTGNLWAAVIYPGDSERMFIDYYSNARKWTDKMPKTIEAWANEKKNLNENVTITFKNK
jgi:hypothetical protein